MNNDTERTRVMYTGVRQVLAETDEYGIARIIIEQDTFGTSRTNDIDIRENYVTVTAEQSIEDIMAAEGVV